METQPLRLPKPLMDEARRIGDLTGRSPQEVIREAARRGLVPIREEEGIAPPPVRGERAA